jgi:peptidoglycan hydrolase-like protein with peptidoglycan-binding domain
MGAHQRRGGVVRVVAFVAALVAAGAGGTYVAASVLHGGGAALDPASASAASATPLTERIPPLRVVSTDPGAGATGIAAASAITIQFSSAIAPASPKPSVSPPVAGSWTQPAPDELSFVPEVGFAPSTDVTVSVPAGSAGPRATDGAELSSPVSFSYTVAPGSVLRLQQLLATLGYLPVSFTPSVTLPNTPATELAEAYVPPPGSFAWRWPNTPPSLQALFVPGQYNVLVRGAVMAFEAAHGLATDGIAGPEVWQALLSAAVAGQVNPYGYTYAYVSKALPESLTVWHDGAVVVQTPANTGIAVAPTADGTFPVYERLRSQIMRGTNPDGTKYADPVAWVAYFNGGDAIHYMPRASYGYPQSLGCVEVPWTAAKTAWPYLTIGTLVTVS